jgi:hypothetical protein
MKETPPSSMQTIEPFLRKRHLCIYPENLNGILRMRDQSTVEPDAQARPKRVRNAAEDEKRLRGRLHP